MKRKSEVRRSILPKPLSLEERLLVLAARLELEGSDANGFGQILASGPDWDRVVSMGERLGCLPLLYRNLSRARWSQAVPPHVQDALAQAYRKAAMRGLRIQGQVQQIRDEAGQRDISVLFLKGAALSGWLYEDVALRPMSDIDVLVKEADVPGVDRMMRDLGYAQDLSIYKSHVHREMASRVSHPAPYSRPNRPNVEVHDALFHHPDMETRLWKEVDAQDHGKGIHRLPLEWMLVHLCVHLEKHLGHSGIVLYWFADIFELAKKCSDSMDWREFERLVDGLGVRDQAARVLGLLKTWWGLDVPALAHWHLERWGREDLPLDPHAAKEAFYSESHPQKGPSVSEGVC